MKVIKDHKGFIVIPAKAGIQKRNTGFRIKCGMTDVNSIDLMSDLLTKDIINKNGYLYCLI